MNIQRVYLYNEISIHNKINRIQQKEEKKQRKPIKVTTYIQVTRMQK